MALMVGISSSPALLVKGLSKAFTGEQLEKKPNQIVVMFK